MVSEEGSVTVGGGDGGGSSLHFGLCGEEGLLKTGFWEEKILMRFGII